MRNGVARLSIEARITRTNKMEEEEAMVAAVFL